MKKYRNKIIFLTLAFLLGLQVNVFSQPENNADFQDKTHFSKVFKRDKTYRLYLPENYSQSGKRYPVIYFFHGWGGRYFKDDNAKLEYHKIKKLVDKYKVILVMWDGSMVESEPRPYNVGNHEHVRFREQMKDYFPELVSHIDSTYRTIPNRTSRGIIGYSMGGFTSFFLSGKYPDMISAAVNMTGSAEFFIGYPENHTLYPLRYTFANLSDVQIRFHNSSEGELCFLNREVNKGALWNGNLNYEYWEFEGGHKVDNPGETIVFEKAMNFVVSAFQHPQEKRASWSHYDLYSNFEVWDYSVKSNKNKPGFIFLRNVSPQGFGFYTCRWLPEGAPLKEVNASLTTAPVYDRNAKYQIKKYDRRSGTIINDTVVSDSLGQLNFELPGTGCELGIYKKGGKPKPTFIDYSINDKNKLIRVNEKNVFTLNVANLGEKISASGKIDFSLKTSEQTVSVENNKGSFYFTNDAPDISLPPVTVYCNKPATTDAAPAMVKFILNMQCDSLTFSEAFNVPVFFDVPDFTGLTVDDGVLVRDSIFGKGNGDGTASPGEKIMIYTQGHRTQLFSDDPYVEGDEEQMYYEALPARWKDDGITASSVVKISSNCPHSRTIVFLAKYETKDYMPINRRVYWGRVEITVK